MDEREKGGRSRVQPIEFTCSMSSSWEIQMQELSWKSSSSSSSSELSSSFSTELEKMRKLKNTLHELVQGT